MKILKCDLCDYSAQGATFEEWMEALKPHYANAHADFMQEQENKSPEEQMAEMEKWMKANQERYGNA